jgi:hypothetical protein
VLARELEALWRLIDELGSDELRETAQERAAALAARLGNRPPVH